MTEPRARRACRLPSLALNRGIQRCYQELEHEIWLLAGECQAACPQFGGFGTGSLVTEPTVPSGIRATACQISR